MPSFDAAQYLAANTDLIRAGYTVQTAQSHYLQFGQYEHRSTTFDALSYVASNSRDLITAFGTNTTAATMHYIQWGYQEHRLTTSFNVLSYEASNTDLITAFGTNTTAATMHYIQWGYQEHRRTSFNAAAYVSANSDLTSAFSSSDQAMLHYIQYGFQEGRITTYSFSTFDSSSYYSSNPDVYNAYSSIASSSPTNLADLALIHYMEHGIWEHRPLPTPTVTPATAQVIQPGISTISGSLTSGQRQTYAVVLSAGSTYTIDELGSSTSDGTLSDPYLRLFDACSTFLMSNDDGGVGHNAHISYQPTQTGTYYISAGSFVDGGSGTYHLTVRPV